MAEQKQRKTMIMVQYHNLRGKLCSAQIEARELPSGRVIFADGHGRDRWPTEIWDYFMSQAKKAGMVK